MQWKNRHILALIGALALCQGAQAQFTLTLEQAVELASTHSLDAQLAKFNYTGAYWSYQSFRAELLPSNSLPLRYFMTYDSPDGSEDRLVSMVEPFQLLRDTDTPSAELQQISTAVDELSNPVLVFYKRK